MKGLRRVFSHRNLITPPSPSRGKMVRTASLPSMDGNEHVMSDMITRAEPIITKWDVDGSTYANITSLFQHNRDEVSLFLDTVYQVNRCMHLIMASTTSASNHELREAKKLMDVAMKRLKKEFYYILSCNREKLDFDSSKSNTASSISESDDEEHQNGSQDDEIKYVGESLGDVERLPATTMADLKAIVDCMVATGYAKECAEIYKVIRKSIVEEGIYRLGFQKISDSQIHKLDWESTEHRIENWLAASRTVVNTLFSGERALCDYIFGGCSYSSHIMESCFAEITRDAAVQFLNFPEQISSAKTPTKKFSTEKMYHVLDLYNTIFDLLPDIDSIFIYESTSTVRSQALTSLKKLGDSIRTTLSEFEAALEKEKTRTERPIRGGGLHPLTRYAVNYLVLLSEYSIALGDIFPDDLLSSKLEWLLLILVCKIDAKAVLYKDVALSYIFLANNLHYIIMSVKKSNLLHLLGPDWVPKQEEKVKSFLSSYEKLAWAKVVAALEKENVTEFHSSFRDAWQEQGKWVLVDQGQMREDVMGSLKNIVLVPYTELYRKRTPDSEEEEESKAKAKEAAAEDDEVRFGPEEVEEYMEGLFRGAVVVDSLDADPDPDSDSSFHWHSLLSKKGFLRRS